MITAIVITKLIKHFLDARNASKESTEATTVDSNLTTNNNSEVAK